VTAEQSDAAARREELGEAFLYKFLPSRPTSELRRQTAEASDKIFPCDGIFKKIIVLVQLLMAEIGAAFNGGQARHIEVSVDPPRRSSVVGPPAR
jgi:hypothetical protein